MDNLRECSRTLFFPPFLGSPSHFRFRRGVPASESLFCTPPRCGGFLHTLGPASSSRENGTAVDSSLASYLDASVTRTRPRKMPDHPGRPPPTAAARGAASVAPAVLRKTVAGESAVLQGARAPRQSRPPAIGWHASPPLSGFVPEVAEIPDEPPICETCIHSSNAKEWTRGHRDTRYGEARLYRRSRRTGRHPRSAHSERSTPVRKPRPGSSPAEHGAGGCTCPRVPSFPSEAPTVPAPLFTGQQVLTAPQAQDQSVNQPAKRPGGGEAGSEADKGLVPATILGSRGSRRHFIPPG